MNISINKLIYVIEIYKMNNKDFFVSVLSHLNFDEINDINNVINGQNIYQMNLRRKNVK